MASSSFANSTPAAGGRTIIFVLAIAALFSPRLPGDELGWAKDGSGVRGYHDTPVQPWSGFRVHDADRPLPLRVDPGPFTVSTPPPADAVILFDGKDLSQWQESSWRMVDGTIEANAGNLVSKRKFGNCQIHVEWMTPQGATGHLFDRGNNGVLLMGLYELQIYDSFTEKLYPDGQAGAIYGQTPPLVNVCRPPGQWQSYDIVFTAPVFAEGKLASPPRMTVFQNGVLVQNHQEIHGEVAHRELPAFKKQASTGPLAFAGHKSPVRLRNIWVRPLP